MLICPARVKTVAIVGAGMAGVSCAQTLAAQGYSVRLFDKGRGPGGRMATRRIETAQGDAHFDHGAQYFTVRDPGFHAVVKDWQSRGLAEPWPLAGPDAWVTKPSMKAVVGDFSCRHDVIFGEQVRGLARAEQGWQVMTTAGSHGPFDAMIVAVPAEQAAPLLALHDLEIAQKAMHIRSQPCWAAMFAFAAPLAVSQDIIRGQGSICWAARNNAKPGRSGPEAWVVQASGQWSAAHIDDGKDRVLAELACIFEREIAMPLPRILASSVHRWRFALSAGAQIGALWNADIRLGACGDWLLGPRVECAWLSGKALADLIGPSANQDRTSPLKSRGV